MEFVYVLTVTCSYTVEIHFTMSWHISIYQVCMITQQRLKELFKYDEETGIFTRVKQTSSKALVGMVAGTKTNQGYIQIVVDSQICLAHRLAWLYVYGALPKNCIDHINHNPGDNRIINLRDVSTWENTKNRRRDPRNTSGMQGVTWHRRNKKWQVQLWNGGKYHYLGQFQNISDAKQVRKQANIDFNFHANHE